MARQRMTLGSKLLLFALALMVLVWLTTKNTGLVGTMVAAVVVVWLVFSVLFGRRRR